MHGLHNMFERKNVQFLYCIGLWAFVYCNFLVLPYQISQIFLVNVFNYCHKMLFFFSFFLKKKKKISQES